MTKDRVLPNALLVLGFLLTTVPIDTDIEVFSSDCFDQNSKENDPPRASGLWIRLYKRLRRKGVVEIDIDHHRYEMLNSIRVGIREIMQNPCSLGQKDELTTDYYSHVSEKKIKTDSGKTFKFYSYASFVFAMLRKAIGVTEESYLATLAPENLPYLEFISNSKGGQNFFLSNNKQYFLKTEKLYNIEYFLSTILRDYLNHFIAYPHSLLVKIVGLYSIKQPGHKMVYFFVMQSVFHPGDRIENCFDVKGCLQGRYQKPSAAGSRHMTILKDKNFELEEINLGQQKDWFLTQLRADTSLLQSLGVLDYSLLIGRQSLHLSERQQALGNVITRVQRSVHGSVSVDHGTIENSSTGILSSLPGLVEDQSLPSTSETHARPKPILELLNFQSQDLSGQNRRLLPESLNPLHVIDGPEHRYFLGIIDFFTQYEYSQKIGRITKTLKFFSFDHSTAPPYDYGERLFRFIQERVR